MHNTLYIKIPPPTPQKNLTNTKKREYLYCILHSNIEVHTKVVIVVQEIGYALLISHAQNFTDFLPLRFFSTGFYATAFKEIRSIELKFQLTGFMTTNLFT